MTYVSIEPIIQAHVAAGRLFPYVPRQVDPDFKAVRRLYMTEEAIRWCPAEVERRSSDPRFKGGRVVYARAALEDFIGQPDLEIGYDLKLLDQAGEVWALRSQAPQRRNSRLFGWFPVPKLLVAVHGKRREELGGAGDAHWHAAIDKVLRVRGNRFPDLPIFRSSKLDDYI